MISRIYVIPLKNDKTRGSYVIQSYILKHTLGKEALLKAANALTNKILEQYSIDECPSFATRGFNYAVEIGFKPGVTDNVAHTVKETIVDLLHPKEDKNLSVYTSQIFLVKLKNLNEVKNFAESLYNPLIERAHIVKKIKDKFHLPFEVPEVVLKKKIPVINVSLDVPDEELIKIGKEGILDPDGARRGPLALDLVSMKVIQAYFKKLKRNPTDVELESLAQTWSEHCKHTIFASPIDAKGLQIKDGLYKTYIKGATNLIRKQKGHRPGGASKNDFCVSVFKDNSGGIIFDKEFLVTHKVETHNSPSALDPFGGAITGVLGVNRDAIGFGLGAKPVANTYGFCFSELDDNRKLFKDKNLTQAMLSPKRIMDGVIKGINAGGNCSGIPTLSGFIKFDDRYRAKPMVFAGTVGLIPRKVGGKLMHQKSAKRGDYIVVVGGRVGLDGIHGATFSSVTLDSNSPATAVQIGDPITQKKLSDALVKEARDMNLYNSITDTGAGGISCSVAEMAKECNGAKVFLEKVPLKYPGLRPWEIWISESQERMTLSVPKKNWKVFKDLMASRGVEATVIGEFTNSGKCTVFYKSKKIMDMELEFLHNGLPKRHLETEPYKHIHSEPTSPQLLSLLRRGARGEVHLWTKILEDLLSKNNLSGFAFISEQYDHEVQASSVLKPLSGPGRINTDAQVFKPVLTSPKGVVLSSALYPSYSDINTYHMAACALDTAVRNAVSAGATLSHLAILDNFCWCSSYDKTRLAELVDALRACYEYAVGYGTPFISGKDSMFNDFNGYDEKGNPVKISIPPTLLISAIGVMPDLYKTVSPEFKNPGDVIYLLGETNNELGASEYFKFLGAIGNNVPKVDLKKNLKTYLALEHALEQELVASSLSVTSGGLGIAIAKASVGGMLGCEVSIKNLPGNATTPDEKLFSESQGRILVSVSPRNIKQFEKVIKNISYTKLGKVSKSEKFIIEDQKPARTQSERVVETNVKKLYKIYHSFSNKMI